jgi:hypothetical protein
MLLYAFLLGREAQALRPWFWSKFLLGFNIEDRMSSSKALNYPSGLFLVFVLKNSGVEKMG